MNDGPVVVVGIPRSGSTLLSRILNESKQLLVVNDLYYLQLVEGIGGFEMLSIKQRRTLVDFILEKLTLRSQNNGQRRLVESLLLSAESLRELRRQGDELVEQPDATWSSLLKDLLSRAAAAEGKAKWGWNTPQDYLHLKRLRKAFPTARFLFLVRDPYSVLASYKNVTDTGNDPHRYNPLIQALHWNLCVKTVQENLEAGCSDVGLVRYEDLVNDTEAALAVIERFVEIDISNVDLKRIGSNSSFRRGPGRGVTPTERWLCDRVIGRARMQIGYERLADGPRLRDIPEVAGILLRSVLFYTKGLASSKNTRRRAGRVMTRLFH